MAKKTQFVRVAVSGPTVDGRNIDPAMLQQAAKNYNRDTYAARGNIEHVRGVSGQPPFGMYADVLAVKAEPVKIEVAGKMQDQIGLFAQLEVSDDLVALNQKGQKLYTSVELLPNFADSKEAYLVGLAFTDSPASLGTQRLQFSKAFGTTPSDPHEVELKLEEPSSTEKEVGNLFAAVTEAIKSFAGKKPAETAPAPAPAATPPAATDLAAFTAAVGDAITKLSAALEASTKANADATAKVASDLAALKSKLETTPATTFTARPPATGGDAVKEVLAEC